ncbi:outer membrane lipoprotein carrier protein LolA [Pseudomonas sp. S35]|uniref:outer membrane lipoprotein carrier protein LolA n=1 Tax=Pseudomonas sp. S35 TaxID=1573719 RepID=UPI001EEB3E44|nr:outer membrane lipoprotein carrier protein LolA [Pseudomonas sp. S35]
MRCPVEAGLPAMDVNDNAGRLTLRGALKFFAGKSNRRTAAPTLIAFVLSICIPGLAHAFDLQQLSDQLAKPSVIHGSFTQEKHLRALPQPLVSKGTFVLAKDHGLLWLLKTPLQQDYRISAQGIARRDANGWQSLPSKSAGAEQNRLFLAVLQGDSSGLQRDFELQLQGEAKQWKLTLIPRSLLLKQVFNQINIDGGELVHTIELLETQGDSTVLRMQDSTAEQPLSDAEQHDFAQ